MNFSEKVRYEKVDQLGKAVISAIANFLKSSPSKDIQQKPKPFCGGDDFLIWGGVLSNASFLLAVLRLCPHCSFEVYKRWRNIGITSLIVGVFPSRRRRRLVDYQPDQGRKET